MKQKGGHVEEKPVDGPRDGPDLRCGLGLHLYGEQGPDDLSSARPVDAAPLHSGLSSAVGPPSQVVFPLAGGVAFPPVGPVFQHPLLSGGDQRHHLDPDLQREHPGLHRPPS